MTSEMAASAFVGPDGARQRGTMAAFRPALIRGRWAGTFAAESAHGV